MAIAIKICVFVLFAIAMDFRGFSFAVPTSQNMNNQKTHQTKVIVLGAGVAGITAAQALSHQSIEDFLIVEYNDEIGGRNRHTPFGLRKNGNPYTVELGSNWIQEVTDNNPIWLLSKKYNISYTFQDENSLRTYNETGPVDMEATMRKFYKALDRSEKHATEILRHNRLDQSERAGLLQMGWFPDNDPIAQAVEWYTLDDENAAPPHYTSQIFNEATLPQSDAPGNGKVIKGDLYVHDQRGFNYFLRREAETFLKPGDPRLLLNTIVTRVEYDSNGIIVYTKSGDIIKAEYAICTFSLGVLKASIASNAVNNSKPITDDVVEFDPPLPSWKQRAISTFGFGTYTKLFLQFSDSDKFWPNNTQLCLYADPAIRGNYPIWQSLSLPGWLPESGIIFATVVTPNSAQIEAQSDDTTKSQLLNILRNMFGKDSVPEPLAFMYPRWGRYPWARGSYSYWPVGVTIQDHENLRGTVDGRLWFAGEATSNENFGFLQGAWFEGREAGMTIGEILNLHDINDCTSEAHYSRIQGTNGKVQAYNRKNGFGVADLPKSALPQL